jgi:Xaa-Pro aminopeptidase
MNYPDRLQRFQSILGDQTDLAFLPISADLQYLTGIPRDMPNFGVTIHPGEWLQGAWLTPTDGPVLTVPRMTAEFGGLDRLPNAQMRVLGDWDDPLTFARDLLAEFALPAKPRIAVSDRAHAQTLVMLQTLLPEAVFHSATDLLRPLRVIKDQDEIAAMRRAGEITEAAFRAVLGRLRPGMTELDVMVEVDYQLKQHGALGSSFTIAMYNSGPAHPLIFGQPERKWHRPLNPPVALLFDFGAIYEGYCYDFGRTVAFGEPDEEFRVVFELVMASQAAGIRALRAGATAEQADAAARQVIVAGGYGEAFRHRLGHGIGLDVHEPPFLTQGDASALREGMLFTVEPSITLFDRCSARVEDVVLVTTNGGEPLTQSFQTLQVVE